MSEAVSGMRCWEIKSVKAECPKCGAENIIDAGPLDDEELWYELPICFWCDACGHEFEVRVDDDDR